MDVGEALGRTLAGDLSARADHPGCDVSAMDGYACREAAAVGASGVRPRRLRVVGESAAGSPFTGSIEPGDAVVISTGAPMPPGCDAIALLERTRREGDSVLLLEPATPRHVRRQGEDLRRAQVYLGAGTLLDPFRLAVAAALGHSRLVVVRRPRVTVMATGRELVRPADARPLLAGGQVFDSNGPLLAALLRAFGAEPLPRTGVGDREEELVAAWCEAALHCDLIVTTGGASGGRHDAVRRVLEGEERLLFGGIRVRPGGPAMLGSWRGRLVLALPGNPVAAALLGTVLLGSWCHAALGRRGVPPFLLRRRAVATEPVRAVPEKTCLWLARTVSDERGGIVTSVIRPQGAARLGALLSANSLLVVPPGEGVEQGATVDVVYLPLHDSWSTSAGSLR